MLKVPDGTLRILVQGAPARAHRPLGAGDALPRRRDLRAARRHRRDARADRADAQRPGDVHAHRRGGPLPARGAAGRRRQPRRPQRAGHLIAGSLRLRTEEKQELLEEVDVARRLRRLVEILARELEVISIGTQIQSQVQSELDKTQREYVLRQQLKAIRKELGEFDESAAEATELREQLDAIAAARGGAPAGRPRAAPPGDAAAAGRRARRHPHLPGVDRLAAVGQVHRGQPRPRARARGARRGPLRHRAGQGPDPRVPRRAPAEAGRARARSSASSARPASARRRSAARSPARSGASSSASAPAACATRPRSAATGAPTSARCRARSSARCATRARTTRCS